MFFVGLLYHSTLPNAYNISPAELLFNTRLKPTLSNTITSHKVIFVDMSQR